MIFGQACDDFFSEIKLNLFTNKFFLNIVKLKTKIRRILIEIFFSIIIIKILIYRIFKCQSHAIASAF